MDTGLPTPLQVGGLSPAKHELGFESPHDLREVFRLHPSVGHSCAAAHRSVLQTDSYSLTRHNAVLRLPESERRLTYDRLLLPVRDGSRRRVLLFSKIVHRESTSTEEEIKLATIGENKPMIREYS